MVILYWAGKEWEYREKLNPTPVSVAEYQWTKIGISFKDLLQTVQEVGVWKDPYGFKEKKYLLSLTMQSTIPE